MQLNGRHLRSLLAFAAFVGTASCALASATITPVEVWRGGDDGLTAKFADALQAKFGASTDFALSSGGKKGTLIVSIPSNVLWKQINGRTQMFFVINFMSIDGRKLGTSKGFCWEEFISTCAAKVVSDARKIRV